MSMLFSVGRKRSQSPSPSRNASPNRSLSPSGSRLRDRSVSPLRYINLPMSKLARVTEELESLINPTASIVSEGEIVEEPTDNPDEQVATSPPQEVPTAAAIEPEESIELPAIPVSMITTEEELSREKTLEPEPVVSLPQISIPTDEKKTEVVSIEVSHRIFSHTCLERMLKSIFTLSNQ
jgi:hypothetical protein